MDDQQVEQADRTFNVDKLTITFKDGTEKEYLDVIWYGMNGQFIIPGLWIQLSIDPEDSRGEWLALENIVSLIVAGSYEEGEHPFTPNVIEGGFGGDGEIH